MEGRGMEDTPRLQNRYLTLKEATARLPVSEWTMHNLFDSQKIGESLPSRR